MRFGPDATRYLIAANNGAVGRPFHLRWLLPKLCRTDVRRWWWMWVLSWPVLFGSTVWWVSADHGWQVAVAAAGLLVGLPGVLGPRVTIPIQVDLSSSAVTMFGCALAVNVSMWAGVCVIAVAAMMSEKAPIIGSLWLWSLWPLVAVFPVVVAAVLITPGKDPLGDEFDRIAKHPVQTAFEAHAGRWRDAWLMVAPWGVTLAALYQPDWRLIVILVVAYAQLLVATDTVRLVQKVAGPPMAVAAATIIPVEWLLLAVVVHVVWWRAPERI